MVNASLNWASIVGIVLAVGGAFLYFMRSFKPALARDYDVFFAAVGLLCGGILFFQGWRLDPILQFGQFLLASTTVFFAYESVRLRGVTTDQARRSSYFEDEEPLPQRPRGGLGGSPDRESEVDRFEEPEPLRRRFRSRDDLPEEDFYRPRRSSRAAIPERAASRGVEPRVEDSEDWSPSRRGRDPEAAPERESARESGRGSASSFAGRYSSGGAPNPSTQQFGARRRDRETEGEARRGSRPVPSTEAMPRSSRRPPSGPAAADLSAARSTSPGVPQGTPIRAGTPARANQVSDADFSPLGRRTPAPDAATGSDRNPEPGRSTPSRDNSSRFDD